MHPAQKQWCEELKRTFPHYFSDKKVLEVGSLDVNGNNRYLFENCEYTGVDVIAGKNVDIVCIAHEFNAQPCSFDVVFSTNALEHDMYYPLTLRKMVELLKPCGLMFFSVAHLWREHGTLRASPKDSGTSSMGKEWGNYYKNLTAVDIKSAVDLKIFEEFSLSMAGQDLRFWGLKNATI